MSELNLNIYDASEDRVSKIAVDKAIVTEGEFYIQGDIVNGPNVLDLEEGDEVVYGLLQDRDDETLFYAFEKVINTRMWTALDKSYEIVDVNDKMRYLLSFKEVLSLVFKDDEFVGLPGDSVDVGEEEGVEVMNQLIGDLIDSGDLEEGGEADLRSVEIISFEDIGDKVKKADLYLG